MSASQFHRKVINGDGEGDCIAYGLDPPNADLIQGGPIGH